MPDGLTEAHVAHLEGEQQVRFQRSPIRISVAVEPESMTSRSACASARRPSSARSAAICLALSVVVGLHERPRHLSPKWSAAKAKRNTRKQRGGRSRSKPFDHKPILIQQARMRTPAPESRPCSDSNLCSTASRQTRPRVLINSMQRLPQPAGTQWHPPILPRCGLCPSELCGVLLG